MFFFFLHNTCTVFVVAITRFHYVSRDRRQVPRRVHDRENSYTTISRTFDPSSSPTSAVHTRSPSSGRDDRPAHRKIRSRLTTVAPFRRNPTAGRIGRTMSMPSGNTDDSDAVEKSIRRTNTQATPWRSARDGPRDPNGERHVVMVSAGA